jgi:hypothetical protein
VVRATAEQSAAVDAVRTHGIVKLEALAGTGKTTALELVARAIPVPATYVTFNKRNADEARKRFPPHVVCRTAHSLAFAAKGRRSAKRRKLSPPSPARLAALLQCERISLDLGGQRLDGAGVALVAWQTLASFVKSPTLHPTKEHLPSFVSGALRPSAADVILPLTRKLWADLESRDGALPVSHDAYLKMWQLTKPTISGDVIFFDEAQDADPVMLDVVRRQNAKQVYVGDRHQAIYEWRGAVNAMEEIAADVTVPLTQSFRFDGSIAAVANEYLAALGAPIRVTGAARHGSRVGPTNRPDVVLARTNAEAIQGVIDTLDDAMAPALVGGTKDLLVFAGAAADLQQGRAARSGPLMRFRRWSEAVSYAESEPESEQDLVSKIRLIEKLGARRVLWALRRCVNEEVADRTFSTAHKAKGREWDQVQLAADFDEVDLDEVEELRLLYVATTRARHLLDRSAVSARPTARAPSARRARRSAGAAPAEDRLAGSSAPRAAASQQPQQETSAAATPKGRPRRKGKRWTTTDDGQLIQRYRAGEPLAMIARTLQRTEGSVKDRLIKHHGVDWRELAEPAGQRSAGLGDPAESTRERVTALDAYRQLRVAPATPRVEPKTTAPVAAKREDLYEPGAAALVRHSANPDGEAREAECVHGLSRRDTCALCRRIEAGPPKASGDTLAGRARSRGGMTSSHHDRGGTTSAEYHGECPACGQHIAPGFFIGYSDAWDGWLCAPCFHDD